MYGVGGCETAYTESGEKKRVRGLVNAVESDSERREIVGVEDKR